MGRRKTQKGRDRTKNNKTSSMNKSESLTSRGSRTKLAMISNIWLKTWANHYTPAVSWVSVKFPEAVKTERLYLQFQSNTCNQ